MKTPILTLLATLLAATALNGNLLAQQKGDGNGYNLQKAYEVLNEEKDEEKALDLVNKQLRDTPDNVAALVLRIRLLRNREEYGRALQDINHALKVNKPKKTEVVMSTLHWWKGTIYEDMEDWNQAVASYKSAYELARKDDRKNLQSISFDYAQALYFAEDYDGADAVYRKMLEEDEADQGAMVGLARNMILREEYQEAIDLLDKCQKYDADYADIYHFKMQAYEKMGDMAKAVDASLEWLEKDDEAFTDAILEVLVKRPHYAEANIKAYAKKSQDPYKWKATLCRFYDTTHRYADAIKAYNDLEEAFGHFDGINLFRSEAYSSLGLNETAIEDISRIMDDEPDWRHFCHRGNFHRRNGDLQAAIADFSAAIEAAPENAFAYYQRGWCYEIEGDGKKALDDYNMGIEMEEDYPYIRMMRGKLLLKEGKKAEAETDFNAVVKNDTVATGGSCTYYALHFLGRDKEAEEWIDKIVAEDPEDPGRHYDKACLLSLMGRTEDAIESLRTAFGKGFRKFAIVRMDDDLDAIRNLPAFKELMEEYEARLAEEVKAFLPAGPEKEETVTEIDVKRSPGGTFEIPCEINGLPLQMILDTGASDVTISSVEANFMFKNGYLSEKDIKGKKYYRTANGQISEGTTVTLREVKIGDAVLHNVDASVVKSQKAPLLLGQSAMERFGTITIDNQNNKLIIKH